MATDQQPHYELVLNNWKPGDNRFLFVALCAEPKCMTPPLLETMPDDPSKFANRALILQRSGWVTINRRTYCPNHKGATS